MLQGNSLQLTIFCINTALIYTAYRSVRTYLCGLQHLFGWDLLAQLCQGSQQVIFALLWQLQDGFIAHDVLNYNHSL